MLPPLIVLPQDGLNRSLSIFRNPPHGFHTHPAYPATKTRQPPPACPNTLHHAHRRHHPQAKTEVANDPLQRQAMSPSHPATASHAPPQLRILKRSLALTALYIAAKLFFGLRAHSLAQILWDKRDLGMGRFCGVPRGRRPESCHQQHHALPFTETAPRRPRGQMRAQ